jgi:ribonuclease VapC
MPELVVDASALVAILNRESEGDMFSDLLDRVGWAVGWATIFETRLWVIRRRPQATPMFAYLLAAGDPELVSFDGGIEAYAAEAFFRFGKGRHPARLNFGDCMSYAVASHLDLPLLFKGSDFGKTDVVVHPASVILP